MTERLAPRTEALDRLASSLEHHPRLVVAFSGGADSALLAFVATKLLGEEHVLCATALSPSLAREDAEETAALASEWGLRYQALTTHEVDNPAYQLNDLNRCYYCKAELMSVLVPVALAERAEVALGVNLDDLGDFRPGQEAAREAGAVFPLVEAGLTKAEVRESSRLLGLRTWDKPANACLSSRIPQGTPVTIGRLGQVERAESQLRALGFSQLRVRHHDDTARIELDPTELPRVLEFRRAIVEAVRASGYRYVTLDLEGFRSGNLVQRGSRGSRRAMSARVRLVYPNDLIREPIVARLVQRFGVTPNIRRAEIGEESAWLVCELEGDEAGLHEALAWLEEVGVGVELLSDVVEG